MCTRTRGTIRIAFVLLVLSATFLGLLAAPAGGGETIQLRIGGQVCQGMLLARSPSTGYLLSRDGRLLKYSLSGAGDAHSVSDSFRSYSQARIRGLLMSEFGRRFEVSGTGHYLVVHPAGQRDRWANRFEQLYRSYVLYFNSRNSLLRDPAFPLVAVVFPDQGRFLAHAAQEGAPVDSQVLGYYSSETNRIVMYDITAARPDVPWNVNAETIIHEATHQMAYNTGLHSRFGQTPSWVVEGLGTMFEAPGVWNSSANPSRDSRLNKHRLRAFRQYAATGRPANSLAEFVSTDNLFKTDASAAYGEAWALTFYLCETHHQQYLAYLKRLAARPAFSRYSAPERLRDFTDVFGSNLPLLEAHYLRYIRQL